MLGKISLLQIGEVILILAAVGFFLGMFIFFPYQVIGESMEPNFSPSDYLLVDKVSYGLRKPHRGEVVVLQHPNWPKEEFPEPSRWPEYFLI